MAETVDEARARFNNDVDAATRARDAEWEHAWKTEVESLPGAEEFREYPTTPDGLAQALRGLVIWTLTHASLERVSRHEIHADDIVVLSYPGRLPADVATRLQAAFTEYFAGWESKPATIILGEGARAAVLSQGREMK